MKLQVMKSDIEKIVNKTKEIALSKDSKVLPILSTLHFNAQDDTLCATSTDLNRSMRSKCSCSIIENGSVCVPAKKLSEIISSLPYNQIELNCPNNILTIKSGKEKFKLMCMPSSEFPTVNFGSHENISKISNKEFNGMAASVLHAVSYDESLPELNGIFVEYDGSDLSMTTTDGRRLAHMNLTIKININDVSVIIPTNFFNTLLKASNHGDDLLGIRIDNNRIFVSSNDFSLSARLIDATFPDYNAFVPIKNNKIATVQKSDFIKFLERMQLLADKDSGRLILTLENNKIIAEASLADVGQSKGVMECRYDSESLSIGINANYMIDALKSIDDTHVLLKMDTEISPILVLPEDETENTTHFCIVMPLRI